MPEEKSNLYDRMTREELLGVIEEARTRGQQPQYPDLFSAAWKNASIESRPSEDEIENVFLETGVWLILEEQIPEPERFISMNKTDGKQIDRRIDLIEGHRDAFFHLDPKTYKEVPIKGAIAEFIQRYLKTVIFNRVIYCYDRKTGVYSQDTGQVFMAINEFARRCDRQDIITQMQAFVIKMLLGMNVFREYPFNLPCHRLPFRNVTLHLNATGTQWIEKPISPDDMVTWRIPHDYDPNASIEPAKKKTDGVDK